MPGSRLRFKSYCFELLRVLRDAALVRYQLVGGILGQCMRSVRTEHREEFWYLLINSDNSCLESQQRQETDVLTTYNS